MKWTKKKPTKEGWYWKRRKFFKEYEVTIDYVREYNGKMCILNWEISDQCEWLLNWEISDQCEWAGPLKEPEE